MADALDISVVIPAYNEEHRIETNLHAVANALTRSNLRAEIVVVDDGSRDGTANAVRRATEVTAGIRLLALPSNRGKGNALRAGIAMTRGARVLLTDADMSTPMSDLDRLWRVLDHGTDIALGSRAVASSNVHRAQSLLRVLLGRAGNLWIRLLAAPGYSDTQCGFKLLDGDIARFIFARCREDRFAIDVEMIALARQMRLDVVEVGVHWEHRDGSKVRPRDYLDVLIAIPRIAARTRNLSDISPPVRKAATPLADQSGADANALQKADTPT